MRELQIDNLIGLLGIRRMDKIPNARIRELWGLSKSLHERIDEGFLRWFCHAKRVERIQYSRE